MDTNVPIVANGRSNANGDRAPAIDCRLATISFLQRVLRYGKVLVDLSGEIQAEYRTHLNPSGQPGVGDRFYQEVLNSAPRLIERVELAKDCNGEYVDLPQPIVASGFDRSDRKFAAIAAKEDVPVVNAVDGDWLEHRQLLEDNGVRIRFLCGSDDAQWFTV